MPLLSRGRFAHLKIPIADTALTLIMDWIIAEGWSDCKIAYGEAPIVILIALDRDGTARKPT